MTDLFGADLPVEGGKGGAFAWRDGPFLQALKAGHWVVFDEVCLCFIVTDQFIALCAPSYIRFFPQWTEFHQLRSHRGDSFFFYKTVFLSPFYGFVVVVIVNKCVNFHQS